MKISFSLIFSMIWLSCTAQSISSDVPRAIDPSGRYLFYLHGGVVTLKGDRAINDAAPEWGRYEYSGILDTLQKRGFNVISEIRKQGVEDSVYVKKIVEQIGFMISRGVTIDSITIAGASAGGAIAIQVSSRIRNNSLKIVLMGGCWPDAYKDYTNIELYGKFLSIIEESDPRKTCYGIFKGRSHHKTFREITLNTGLNHGFIYRGIKEWVDPVVEWSRTR